MSKKDLCLKIKKLHKLHIFFCQGLFTDTKRKTLRSSSPACEFQLANTNFDQKFFPPEHCGCGLRSSDWKQMWMR